MTPEKAYETFMALKMHFTTKYDFVKYNGKFRGSSQPFNMRKDKYTYVSLARKHGDKLKDFIVSNMINGDHEVKWAGTLLTDKCEENYIEWRKRTESITYILKQECDIIADCMAVNSLEFKDVFKVKEGQHPILLKMYFQKYISLETLLILASLLGFLPKWDKEIHDDIIWPEISTRLKNYKPFLEIDKPKFQQVIKESFK